MIGELTLITRCLLAPHYLLLNVIALNAPIHSDSTAVLIEFYVLRSFQLK